MNQKRFDVFYYNNVVVVGRCWSMVVGFGFKYLTPIVLLLTPFNMSASLSKESCKRI